MKTGGLQPLGSRAVPPFAPHSAGSGLALCSVIQLTLELDIPQNQKMSLRKVFSAWAVQADPHLQSPIGMLRSGQHAGFKNGPDHCAAQFRKQRPAQRFR